MKLQYYIFWLLFIFHGWYLFSQIVNEDTLAIMPNTTLYFDDEYINQVGARHYNEGHLYLNNNFINNGVTRGTYGTTYFISTTHDIQRISGISNTVYFSNLVIQNSLSGVEVVNDFGLVVKDTVKLMDGDLRLLGGAQLIQTHTGISTNSAASGSLLKDQQGNHSAYAFNYWSSPVNNSGTFSLSGSLFDGTDADLSPFSPQPVQFVTGSPYNGLPSVTDGTGKVVTPLSVNTYWLYKYSRGAGYVSNWIKIDENTGLLPGEGFTMKGTNTSEEYQNYVFKGIPNDGEYIFEISQYELSLLGNPYPSALDTDEFIKTNISISDGGYASTNIIYGTLYYWVDGGSTSHSYSGYYGGYATRNLTAGAPPSVVPDLVAGLGTSSLADPPTQYMAVGQGFFVEATGNGNIIFKNDQRVFKTESSGESIHYKSENTKAATAKSLIRLGYDDPEGFHRQIVLGFLPDTAADLNYNIAYDAFMFGVRPDDFFFIIENDITKKYVIQGVGAFDPLYEFRIGLTISEEGNHHIQLDGTENFEEPIYLKDSITGEIHNLSEAVFEPDLPPGEYLERFKIVFKSSHDVLGLNELEAYNLKVYFNDNHLVIENMDGLRINEVAIYNVIGQLLLKEDKKIDYHEKILLPFSKKTGVYLIKIDSEQGQGNYKIIKKN